MVVGGGYIGLELAAVLKSISIKLKWCALSQGSVSFLERRFLRFFQNGHNCDGSIN